MKKTLLFLLALLIGLAVVLAVNTLRLSSKQLPRNNTNLRSDIKEDTAAIAHLAEAIQIQTVSYDDSARGKSNAVFDSLFTVLRKNYPAVFTSLQDTVINGRNLLLKWTGTKPSLLPVILYAHMDVVPIEVNTLSQWKHAPFSGDVANDGTTPDRYIWGRGALDDKGSLIAIYEAVNRLLQKGYKPERTIYFASGSDEEIGGLNGAQAIAAYCRENKLHFDFYLDEGGTVIQGVVPGVDRPVALIGTSEKGYITLDLSVSLKGGHSSQPAKETALDVLLEAVKKVHDNPFEKKACQSVDEFMDYIGPEMQGALKVFFANRWLFKPVILSKYTESKEGNALVRTTSVTTIMNAGVKENVIPSRVNAKINFRILPGESCASVLKHVKEVINDERVLITPGEKYEPSAVTASAQWGFNALQTTVAAVFPDALVAPFLMLGSTDSKHFSDLTNQTYRFFPVRMDRESLGSIHGINERIKVSSYMESIAFYEQLINNLDASAVQSEK
jgi:carboxypeptidase PM20D1